MYNSLQCITVYNCVYQCITVYNSVLLCISVYNSVLVITRPTIYITRAYSKVVPF